MKRILYRFLSLALLILSVLWPTSCKRIIDTELSYIPKPVNSGAVLVKSNVYVLDSTQNNKLIELTGNTLRLKNDYVLKNGRVAASFSANQLKQGDILVGYASPVAPNGFWAKIITSTQSGNETKIDYEEPSFTDIIDEIDQTFEIEWDKVDKTVEKTFTVSDKQENLQASVQGKVTVNLGYDIVTQLELIRSNGEWKKIRIENFLKRQFKTNLEVSGKVSYKKEENIICSNLKSKLFFIGFVPVYIKPVMRFDVTAELEATARINRNIIDFKDLSSIGTVYNGKEWSKIESEIKKPAEDQINAEVKGKIEVGLKGTVEGYFYQFLPVDCQDKQSVRLSIGAGTKAYIGLEGICSTDKGLQVRRYTGLEGSVSAKVKLFKLIDADPNYSKVYSGDIDKWIVQSSFCSEDSDSQEPPVPNQVEEASTSVSTADPHMTTFDRGRYDFMAVGEFVAAKSTTDNFQVQVRQAPYPSSTQVSVNTGVAMLVDNDRVCVYPGPSRLYVNNQAINLSFTEYPLNGGGSIQYANGNLSIKNRNGDRIEVKLLGNDLDYFITPAKNRSGKLEGLFGNYDGNPSNDLVQASGTRISNTYQELYPAFADSWRITQNQSLFVYETGKTTDSYTDKTFPRSEIHLTTSQRTAAEQTCRQAGVTDPDALEGCIVDVALTGNQTFVERAKQNQIISNAKSILSASNFSQYRNEFTLSSDATVNGSTVLLNSKGTIGWNDAYLNRDGYETEIVLSINAPTPCFPLFDINVMDNTATGDPNQNYLRLSANGGKTQVELVNSGSQQQQHPVNLFDGNRHRIRIATTKALSGSQTTVRILIYIDNYEPLTINRSYASSSLAGYLYPMLKNETINCLNGQITIFGWSFKSQ